MASKIPKPGSPVRGSKTGKPIMALFDLLGRTWSLGVIWQLSERCLTFRELQEKCELSSPNVLNQRIKELVANSIIERGDTGYQLTEAGRELFLILEPLGTWSQDWARKI